MKKRILYLLIAFFSLSLASDIVVNLFDYGDRYISMSMDCDENDMEDREELDKESQEFTVRYTYQIIQLHLQKDYTNRYLFSKSTLKASPELPPPDRA